MKKRIAIFASGNGSNFQVLVDEQRKKDPGYEISLLICDRPGAPVIARANQAGIPTFVFQPKEYADKAAYEAEILRELKEAGIEWIVLAGYMRIIGAVLLKAYGGKIINLHPSLLPAFPGKDAIRQAFDYGVKVTGITIHYVDEGLDTGPIIAQEIVPLDEADTYESLCEKIHSAEHRLLPKVVEQLTRGEYILSGRKVLHRSSIR